MSEIQQILIILMFTGVAVSLVLTVVNLLAVNTLRISVDALRETVAQQTRLLEYLGREMQES